MPDNPPPSYITDSDSADLYLHNYQIYDVVRGSGSVDRPSGVGLYLTQCGGSGPLYDVWFVDDYPHADSGIDEVKVGDFLLVADDTDDLYTTSAFGWYRYNIEEILTSATAKSGEFRVRYVTDNTGNGDDSPCDLHLKMQNDGYGYSEPSQDCNVIARSVNTGFLID